MTIDKIKPVMIDQDGATNGQALVWNSTSGQYEPGTVSGSGSGDVVGPASSTDNAVARFDSTTGKIVQNSSVTIDDVGNISTSGTVDGRDVATDGTKLDGIEAGADVTLDVITNGVEALTTAEVNQLENINTTTISSTQWGYLGNLDQNLTTNSNVDFNTATISNSDAAATLDLTNAGAGTTLNINNSGSGDFIVVDTNKMVLDNSGNLAISGTVDGRDVAADGTTLDTINSNYITASSTTTLTNKTFDANGTGNSISNIDVADLANGTDGELITWDATGAPATVAAGTAGQVLTSNGAGAAPTFQTPSGGGGGAWTYIGSATASGGTIVISGLDFTTYKAHMVVGKGIQSNNTTGQIFARPDNVITSVYDWAYMEGTGSNGSTSSTVWQIVASSRLNTTAKCSFTLFMINEEDSNNVYFGHWNSYVNGASQFNLNGGGAYTNATAPTSITFQNGQSAGTIADGTVELWGLV